MPKRFCCEPVSCGTFERLEPDEGKLSRPVLRGGGDGDVASLPGGETLSSSGEGATSYGFAGEWKDESGLVYLRARYYSPGQGRFLNKDVWEGDYETPMSLNGWLFVYANPINLIDPTGFYCVGIYCPEPVPTPPLMPKSTPQPSMASSSASQGSSWILFTMGQSTVGGQTVALVSQKVVWNLLNPPGVSGEYGFGATEVYNTARGTVYLAKRPGIQSYDPTNLSNLKDAYGNLLPNRYAQIDFHALDGSQGVPVTHLNADIGPWAQWNHWELDDILTHKYAPPELKALAQAAKSNNFFFTNRGARLVQGAGKAMLVIGLVMDAADLGTAVYNDTRASGTLTFGINTKYAIGRVVGANIGASIGGAAGAKVCAPAYPPVGSLVCGCAGAVAGGYAGSLAGIRIVENYFLGHDGGMTVFVISDQGKQQPIMLVPQRVATPGSAGTPLP